MLQQVASNAMDTPIMRPWWQRRNWMHGGIAAAALILGGVVAFLMFGSAERSVRMAERSVTIAPVTRGAFHDFVPLHAKVVALDTIYLDALEGGRVEHVLAQAGDAVIAGQPLVELTNTELELDVLDREGRLIESITQLQSYETQLEQNRIANQKALAQIDYDIVRLQRSLERRKQLATRGLESAEARDNLQDELNHTLKLQPMQAESNRKQDELRVRQLPQIQSQIEKLQQDLKITHSKLENLIVRAPVTGRLTAMDLKVGENRNRGERFAEITPDTGNKLTATVDEFYLSRVHTGQSAAMEANGRMWTLKVARVYPQVKDGTFTIDLEFQGASPVGLLPGQALQGKLGLGTDHVATLIPTGAFLDRTGGDWVFVVAPGGRFAHRRTIRIGRRNAEQLEVVANLAPGERVIISDYTGLERIERIDLTR